MPDGPPPHLDLLEALERLSAEIRRQAGAHPGGHLLSGGSTLDVRLRVPVLPRNGELQEAAREAGAAIETELGAVLTRRALFRPGRVFCLRCARIDCEHSAPTGPREVFAGYSPSGVPRFLELGPYLLERGDPRVDQLYREPPPFLILVIPGTELTGKLLTAFLDSKSGFRLHGQVVAGWYRGQGPDGLPAQVALSFQIASTQSPRSRRLYGLNLVGVGPEGESLEAFCSRLGEVPWAGAVRWAQALLEQMARDRRADEAQRDKRLAGILKGLAARLDKNRRAEDRRTHHAREHHQRGDRPTRMALADLHRARPEESLIDTRRDTLVVLGDRGRAHVWNRDGKHVTSIRYTPEAIAKKQKAGLWRPARQEEVAALREAVRAAPNGAEAL